MNLFNGIKFGIYLVCALFVASSSHGSELQRLTMQVSNISCSSCVGRIESELKKLPGMVGMSTDLQKGIVEVDHSSSLDPEEIAQSIAKMGYPAQVLSTQAISPEEASVFSKGAVSCGLGGCGGPKNCGAAGSAWKDLYRRFIKKTTE